MDHGLPTMPATVSRKRSRENESPSQRHKREKAAERQRRKRERDRAQNMTVVSDVVPMPAQHQQPPPPPPMPVPPPVVAGDFSPAPPALASVAPEDMIKRERIRMAARERQRKHRAMVKQKKMRELGLDMGNDILPGMAVDDVSYRMASEHHPPPFGVLQPAHQHPHDMQPPPAMPPPHEGFPPPQGQLGGQTFASTLLLSFSCAPLLKAHLLRTLGMSNEELASLEPIIASAWDQWDYQRRLHHAAQAHAHAQAQAQAASNGLPPPEGGSDPNYGEVPTEDQQQHQHQHQQEQAYEQQQQHDQQQQQQQDQPPQPSPNDFRARFARSLVAPSPFRTFEPQQGDGLEHHLVDVQKAAIDPELGQARGEAEGVVGRLEGGR